ncbi:calmodulin-binding protein [Nonomuraea sp. NPDC049419]|uniref:BP74-related protein n=1 Tax=Nonomuraea sp. NPDC049419 TaxID=3155772 RepID=UPI003420D225
MSRTLNKVVAVLAAITMLGLTTATPAHAVGEAYFRFTDSHGYHRFTIQLRDADKIAHARRVLSGAKTRQVHVLGRIHKYPASYNHPWSYHLDPGTIGFFEVAIEVCDSTIEYLEDHLDEAGGAFLPGAYWCPWSSRLVDEVRPS